MPRSTPLVVVGLGSSPAGWPQGLCTQLLHLCVVSTVPRVNGERGKRKLHQECYLLHEACLNSFRQTGTQSYSLSVTAAFLSLSLPVWEVLEGRGTAGVNQICFLVPARALAPERREHRNQARLGPPRSLLQTQPPPSHSSGGRKLSQISNLFQVYL